MEKSKTMQEIFKGYTLYSDKEYNDIWQDSIIVLDTNILLNLFRYTKKTKNEMLKLLQKFQDKIWIPYQVGTEYFKNRDIVIKEAGLEYQNLKDIISNKISEMSKEVSLKEKKILEVESLNKIIMEFKTKFETTFANIQKKHEEEDHIKNNLIIEKEILELISTRIGTKPDEKRYSEITEEGSKRTKEKTPPGYKDSDKEINGDYIVFSSFMEHAKEVKKNVIFITDDVKEDWFYEVKGEKKGGRPELLHEFYETTGKLLLIYSFNGFANKYNELNPNNKISEDAINEVYTTSLKENNNSDSNVIPRDTKIRVYNKDGVIEYKYDFYKEKDFEEKIMNFCTTLRRDYIYHINRSPENPRFYKIMADLNSLKEFFDKCPSNPKITTCYLLIEYMLTIIDNPNITDKRFEMKLNMHELIERLYDLIKN